MQVYVGTIPYPYDFSPSAVEIAEVLEVPINTLLDPANLRVETRWEDGKAVSANSYACGSHLVYGATARVLEDFLGILAEGTKHGSDCGPARRNTDLSTAPLPEIETELSKLPPAVLEAYQEASGAISTAFGEEELALWAREGVAIGTQTVRSWESAVEYYRVGPQVARFLSFPSFMQWARCGTYLAQDSPTLAVAFFKASSTIVPNLRPQYIPRWAGLGRSLYKGTWKSSTLAAKFFEVSPDLVRNLPFWDVEVFASLIEALSYKSYDVAGECLVLGRDVLPAMGREREAFLSMSRALIDASWREVKTCLELVPRALQQVDDSQTGRFLKLGERLAKTGLRDTSRFLADGTQALGRVPQGSQGYILDLSETLLAASPDSVPHFLRSLNDVLGRITINQLDTWFRHGLDLLKENPESGIAFFKVESNTSVSMLDTLSSSLELERVKGIIKLYCSALSGSSIEVLDTQELVRKNIGWIDEDSASTDGTKVFLPPVVDHYPSKQDNFAWFKVVSTHQVGHLEFGSFSYDFQKPSSLFEDRRFQLEEEVLARRSAPMLADSDEIEPGPGQSLTDIGRFLNLFDNRRLAFDIFTVLEDCRLDFRINVEYPGIRRAAKRVQDEALANRPNITEMALQEAMVELLIHMSLEQFTDLPVPVEYEEVAVVLARILHQLRTASATVEDTSEATLRAYEIITRVPNETQSEDQWEPEDLEEPGDFSEEEYEDLLERLQANMEASAEGGEGDPYDSPDPVDYRGDFKPGDGPIADYAPVGPGHGWRGRTHFQGDAGAVAPGERGTGAGRGAGRHNQQHEHVRPEPDEGGRHTTAQLGAGPGLRPLASRRRPGRGA